jgi:hypothetical protein
LHGRLNIEAFRNSVAEIVRRQDALRTRIVVYDGIPAQEISKSGDCELELDDLTGVSSGTLRDLEIKHLIEKHILKPIDVAVGPLFGIRLVKCSENEHVLLVAMEHMISDAFSMNILLRDLFAAYTQALKGLAFSLPEIPIQVADYAVWQRTAHQSWLERHGTYWGERLKGCRRVRFPTDNNFPRATVSGWGAVRLRIGRDMRAELRDWCRLRQTTLVMTVFTAYVALVLRWCNVSEIVIQYLTDGRSSPELENTIGFFASGLYLRIALREDDRFVDLKDRVTQEYCEAYTHADHYFLEAQVPRPDFTLNTAFNWLPHQSTIDDSDLERSEEAITCSPVPFVHPMLKCFERDSEPVIVLVDTGDEIVGDVSFPLNRFRFKTMETFGHNFLVFLNALLNEPEQHVKDILLLHG